MKKLILATRRHLLFGATAAVLCAGLLAAGSAAAFEPGNLECIAPANPGGGWDFTCRQVGKTMYELKKTPSPVQVTNKAGGGGAVAFAEVVAKRNTDNNLIVAASSSTTTRLAQGQYAGFTADQVRWLGSVGTDYGIIAVAKSSPYTTLSDLMNAIKTSPGKIAVGGGSAVGGWDHLKVLIAAKAAGITNLRTIKYVAFQGGGEAVTQLIGDHIQAFSGDVSESLGFLESGDLRVLAVLAPERLPGALADLPTAKEQGVDAIGTNWRGFYGPGKMSEDAYAYWSQAIHDVATSDEWKKVMADNGMVPFALSGPDLAQFVSKQIVEIQDISREIGLIK
ncbi:MAG: tripartite tricarboxylate transporter substrate binding protein [Rhodospirillales bacterium]|nr:tripartite tricarboxylate transporter substrate binding protein [Rhodospirillales bacterium]